MELSNKIYFPDEIWIHIKDFMPTWKENHSRKLNESFENKYIDIKKGIWKSIHYVGIKAMYPLDLKWESYSLKNKLYVTSFLVPWSSKPEIRICNFYETKKWKRRSNFIYGTKKLI